MPEWTWISLYPESTPPHLPHPPSCAEQRTWGHSWLLSFSPITYSIYQKIFLSLLQNISRLHFSPPPLFSSCLSHHCLSPLTAKSPFNFLSFSPYSSESYFQHSIWSEPFKNISKRMQLLCSKTLSRVPNSPRLKIEVLPITHKSLPSWPLLPPTLPDLLCSATLVSFLEHAKLSPASGPLYWLDPLPWNVILPVPHGSLPLLQYRLGEAFLDHLINSILPTLVFLFLLVLFYFSS